MFKSVITMRILLSLLAVILMAIMVKLGFWQLDRSEFKASKQTMFNDRVAEEIKELPAQRVNTDDWSYFRVRVSGRYLREEGFFVDNVVHNTRTGLSVVTPLQIADTENLILINRGWLPWGSDRTFLPVVETPDDVVELTGLLVPATEGHFYLGDPEESQERTELWLQLDLKRFQNAVDKPVQPLILILDADQPSSYDYIWNLQDDSWIARHRAYAFQWFALAAALLVITLILNLQYSKRRRI